MASIFETARREVRTYCPKNLDGDVHYRKEGVGVEDVGREGIPPRDYQVPSMPYMKKDALAGKKYLFTLSGLSTKRLFW